MQNRYHYGIYSILAKFATVSVRGIRVYLSALLQRKNEDVVAMGIKNNSIRMGITPEQYKELRKSQQGEADAVLGLLKK